MENLKYLEFQRLIKELQFVEADYIYQHEIIRQSDKVFLEEIELMLNKFPELKNILKEKKEMVINQVDINPIIEEIETQQPLEVKQIYREILKSTHPDKIKNTKLNELYLEATNAYESGDLVTLYKVCSVLMIDFANLISCH